MNRRSRRSFDRRIFHWNRPKDEARSVEYIARGLWRESGSHHHPFVSILLCENIYIYLTLLQDSMEEASALADTVAIMAKRLLAVGSLESLASRYPIYEVQFNCNSRDDVARAHRLMKTIPGSKMADELATRFEVPIDPAEGVSLAKLFKTLSSHDHFAEYSVEKITLERVFMRVIQENNVKEEDLRVPARGWWRLGF